MENREKNSFKKLITDNKVPKEIKEVLFKDIAFLQLFSSITDLFSGKMGHTAIELLKRNTKH